MNRKERRMRARKGEQVKSEPTYHMKLSEIGKLAINPQAQKAVIHEIHQQCLEADKTATLDMDTMYLWTLHQTYGWGYKRLKQFYLDVFREHVRMRRFYEMDDMYPERYKLKTEVGIDLEEWYNRLFDAEGNFKDPDEVEL